MDYDYILNKVFAKAEYFMIKQFKEFKTIDRPFPNAVDKIKSQLSKKYANNLIGRNYNLFESCYRFFCFRKDYYGDTTSISKIIENEIKEEFESVTKVNRAVDKNYKVIDNYSFNQFIYDLITYHSLRKIEERLGENSDLYKLIYNSGNYSSFTLEVFDGHVINSELYRKLFSKIYPDKFIPHAVKHINQYRNVEWEIIYEEKLPTNDRILINSTNAKIESDSSEMDSLIFQISKFSENEKIFLWHVLYNAKTKFKYPEFAKILLITDGIKDLSIFHEKAGSNSLYRKINEGIQYYKPIKRRTFIEELMKKLEYFNLTTLNAEINLIKNKIP